MPENKKVKINSITREFNSRLGSLLSKGIDREEVIEKLRWNKAGLSLTENNVRNIPPEKWDLFNEVFKYENTNIEQDAPVKDLIGELQERLINVEAQAEVYKNVLAVILSNYNSTDLPGRMAELNNAISEAVRRRVDELRKK